MPLNLSILYRGPLSSCNYDCSYCPFAKHWESPEELARDRASLARFVGWITDHPQNRFAVFFTPWGEALVRRWYRDAVVSLSQLPNVVKVAVQTNLSCALDWLRHADVAKVGLWCTYHPNQTTRAAFLDQCRRLDDLAVRYSVGCVGLREHGEEIARLREALPPSVYLWINAYKDARAYYDQRTFDFFAAIDPLFPINSENHASLGRSCRSGSTVVAVDGDGNVRRCHFVADIIGNLYARDFAPALTPRPCPNATCDCHIGYVHLEHLRLDEVFGESLLERIPAHWRDGRKDDLGCGVAR